MGTLNLCLTFEAARVEKTEGKPISIGLEFTDFKQCGRRRNCVYRRDIDLTVF